MLGDMDGLGRKHGEQADGNEASMGEAGVSHWRVSISGMGHSLQQGGGHLDTGLK